MLLGFSCCSITAVFCCTCFFLRLFTCVMIQVLTAQHVRSFYASLILLSSCKCVFLSVNVGAVLLIKLPMYTFPCNFNITSLCDVKNQRDHELYSTHSSSFPPTLPTMQLSRRQLGWSFICVMQVVLERSNKPTSLEVHTPRFCFFF